MLENREMILMNESEKEAFLLPKKQKIRYEIFGSILVDSPNFEPIREYFHGEFISSGSLVAQDGEKKIYADRDCHVVMPAVRKMYKKCTGEEYCFL